MSLGRVLVVDDDKNICELLRLYLEKEGYGVILAHDGEEAVVKFNALKPDIILLDIMLPGINLSAKSDSAGSDASGHRWLSGLP